MGIPPGVSAHAASIDPLLHSNCSARGARSALAVEDTATVGLLLSHSTKMRVAGQGDFHPSTAHRQLSGSSSLELHNVVSKGCVLAAAGLEGNPKNTSWNQFYESFTENTFTDEKHI